MDVFIAAQFAVVFTLIAYGFVVVVAVSNAFILSVKNIRLQCLYFSVLTSYTTETSRTSVLQSGGGFYLDCEDFGRMFDHSFPNCA